MQYKLCDRVQFYVKSYLDVKSCSGEGQIIAIIKDPKNIDAYLVGQDPSDTITDLSINHGIDHLLRLYDLKCIDRMNSVQLISNQLAVLADVDIVKLIEHAALHCKSCKDLYPYALPNQVDGTLICYSCRNMP